MNWRGRANRVIRKSRMHPSDRAIFRLVCDCADNETGEIAPQYAPTLAELASDSGHGRSTVIRSLAHLELHRYLARDRSAGGRGIKTVYVLLPDGEPQPCECPDQRRAPARALTEAERAKRYRAARKQVQSTVTDENKQCQSTVTNSVISRDDFAGQKVFPVRDAARDSTSPHPLLPRDGSGVSECIGGCGRLARRSCVTCWQHAHMEMTPGQREAIELAAQWAREDMAAGR